MNSIFTSEQTEGRSVEPYHCIETMDFCEKCYGWHMKGNVVFGSGAMGFNQYCFLASCRDCETVRNGKP